MLTVAAALLFASSDVHLTAERVQTTRVHLLVASPTRAIVVTRVQPPGQYLPDMLAVETVCRNECDLDVDVDPRLNYVLEVVGDTPGEDVYRFRYDVDMTTYGSSLVLKVEPPTQARFTASRIMVPVGIGVSIASTVVTLLGSIVVASGGRQNIFGADPIFFAAGGAGGIVLGVATCIIGVVLRRSGLMDVTAMPGTTPPAADPFPLAPVGPQGPIQM